LPSNTRRRRTSRPARRTRRATRSRYWSAEVRKQSDALDLERGVFTRSPRRIALSLKRSAETSKRRKGTPYQSAMSMLNFFINRAGRTLNARQKAALNRAKGELREVFGRA
jgi:putative cell wall-binding protein